MKKIILVILMLLPIVFLIGCTESYDPNGSWCGKTWEISKSDSGIYTAVMETTLGNKTKILNKVDDRVLDLELPAFYCFHFYVKVGDKGNVNEPPEIVYIEDLDHNIVWER